MTPLVFPAERLVASREYYLAHRPRLLGLSIRVVVLLVIGALAGASIIRLEEVARGSATIRPARSVSTVRNVVAGHLVGLTIRDGARVRAGATLYVIHAADTHARLAAAAERLRETEVRLATARRVWVLILDEDAPPGAEDGLPARARHRVAEFRHRDLAHRVTIASAEDAFRRERARPAELVTTTRLAELEAELSLAIAERNAWRNEEIAAAIAEATRLRDRVTELTDEIALLRVHRDHARVRAPISGRIRVLQELNAGDFLAEGEAVLEIVPDESDHLRARVDVPAHDIAGIWPGMPVRITMESLPPSEYGFLGGTVAAVPPDATVEGTTPVFRITCRVPATVTNRLSGAVVRLRPGMVGAARIVRGRKAAILFLVDALDFR